MTSTQEQAQEAAAQAKDKAGEAAQQAKGRARQQLDQRSTTAGEQVTAQASDVRSVASALRDQGKDKPAEYAEKAADKVEQFGGYLKDADSDQLLHDLEDLGRKQPMAVVFGGLALGFAASRFLKASSEKRYEGVSAGTGYTPRPVAPALPPTTTTGVGTGTIPAGGTVGAPVPPATGIDRGFPDPVGPTDPVTPTPHPVGGL